MQQFQPLWLLQWAAMYPNATCSGKYQAVITGENYIAIEQNSLIGL